MDVDDHHGVGKDSEAEDVAEEGKVARGQGDVLHEDAGAPDLPDVDIEDVGHQRALEDVAHGEKEGPHGDVVEGHIVVKAVLQIIVDHLGHPGHVQDLLHDEEDCHAELQGSLHTPADPMSHPGICLNIIQAVQ